MIAHRWCHRAVCVGGQRVYNTGMLVCKWEAAHSSVCVCVRAREVLRRKRVRC